MTETPKPAITRFAPSPTGMLHIGGVRTALFNYLWARHTGGKFLLRIEDTDKERSTPQATAAILSGMEWIGLSHDQEIVYQSKNMQRHQEVAQGLLEKGLAYESYETGDGTKTEKPAVRLKVSSDGETKIQDLIQGEVTVQNDTLDDLVILRSDGTPTYMLAVVVDDHDMGITHVIRGDDHLINTFRQLQIYKALGWPQPEYAHVPLIHGTDGGKLSKRHGAVGTREYQALGILPEALFNYLMRLGWSHGDDEIISKEDAIQWFNISDVNKSAARLDMDKLLHVNAHYLREMDNKALLELALPFFQSPPDEATKTFYLKGMDDLKERAHTLVNIVESGIFYTYKDAIPLDEKAQALLSETDASMLADLEALLTQATDWAHETLFESIKTYAKSKDLKVGKVAQVVRAKVTGTTSGPSVFNILETLGKDETLRRFGL